MRAPPESLMPTIGQPVFRAKSMTLTIFSPKTSPRLPPKTVKSCANTATWRPSFVAVMDRRLDHGARHYADGVSTATGSRDAARFDMPEALRADVRLLGDALGEILREYGGEALLADVERLRELAIAAHHEDATVAEDAATQAEKLVSSWPVERAEDVARAFTVYFHLVNVAEEHHRIRALRAGDRVDRALSGTVAAAVEEVAALHGTAQAQGLLAELEFRPVLTAHPTEARRRAVVTAIRRIAELLERRDDPRLGASEEFESRRRLLEVVDVLWRTAQLRAERPGPLDEVRTAMTAFDEVLFRVVPQVYRRAETALAGERAGASPPRVPAFVRLGSWIGGDRDGNPSVTSAVTRQAMAIQSDRVLWAIERACDLSYASAAELLDELKALQRSLASAGAPRQAYGERQHLIWQVESFGFHLAEMEVRQHSAVHAAALAEIRAGGSPTEATQEVLATLRVMAQIQQRWGADACRRYVVSFTRSADDVAAVYELARVALDGRELVLDVVPLFETGEDLTRCVDVLDAVIALPDVRRRISASGRRFEVMLGYSDSAKDIGPVSATLALYDAQARLTAWAGPHPLKP